jgi:hypothetical protein
LGIVKIDLSMEKSGMRLVIAIASIGLLAGCASSPQNMALPQQEKPRASAQAAAVPVAKSAPVSATDTETKPAGTAPETPPHIVEEVQHASATASSSGPSESITSDGAFNPVKCMSAWVNVMETQADSSAQNSNAGKLW